MYWEYEDKTDTEICSLIFGFREDDNTAMEKKDFKKSLIKCGWTIIKLCECYLEWSYLVDVKNEIAIKYNNLYEPIIKLFERGGKISYHKNELICGKIGWPRNCYTLPRKVFIKKISNDFLDNIDYMGNYYV